jgi:hypothetical protein
VIPGHVVWFSRQDGTGVLATDSGNEIRFGPSNVAATALSAMQVGDRAWWLPDDAGGKLVCISARTPRSSAPAG